MMAADDGVSASRIQKCFPRFSHRTAEAGITNSNTESRIFVSGSRQPSYAETEINTNVMSIILI